MLHVCNQFLKRISNNGSIIGNLAAAELAKREVLLIRTSARDLSSPTEGGGQVNYPLEEVRGLGNRKGNKLFIRRGGSQRRLFFWETPPQSRPLFTAYVFLTETF